MDINQIIQDARSIVRKKRQYSKNGPLPIEVSNAAVALSKDSKMSVLQIAKALGVSKGFIYKAIKEDEVKNIDLEQKSLVGEEEKIQLIDLSSMTNDINKFMKDEVKTAQLNKAPDIRMTSKNGIVIEIFS